MLVNSHPRSTLGAVNSQRCKFTVTDRTTVNSQRSAYVYTVRIFRKLRQLSVNFSSTFRPPESVNFQNFPKIQKIQKIQKILNFQTIQNCQKINNIQNFQNILKISKFSEYSKDSDNLKIFRKIKRF